VHNSCSGVILAGGLNKRLAGTKKALISLCGKRILDRICEIYDAVFDEIILVTNEPQQYLDFNFNIVTDLLPIRSSLTGIHTGLFYASHPFVFFAACDTPFLKHALIEHMVDEIEAGFDVIIPQTQAGFEPLCAVYSKDCFQAADHHLARNQLKIQKIFRKKKVKTISEKKLREKDADLLSFFNINTPEDLVKAEELSREIFF
jgi:molybdopterin-guanine dinucleotide biosynthesis protein A